MRLPPSPRKRQSITLTKTSHVRAELAKLYSEARRGLVPVGDASRLANMLQILARIIADSDLELRIGKLEELLAQKENR